ncbi:MAG: DUF6378 domain-containing protein, partial [Wohlfahrtiimonas sp.]
MTKYNHPDVVCWKHDPSIKGIVQISYEDEMYEILFDDGMKWVEGKLIQLFTPEPVYETKSKREEILDTAKKYVTSDRNKTHGEPEDSFGMIAKLWSAYTEKEFTSVDVCVMLALLKVARIKNMPTNEDNWVDLAGYSACGGEVASM